MFDDENIIKLYEAIQRRGDSTIQQPYGKLRPREISPDMVKPMDDDYNMTPQKTSNYKNIRSKQLQKASDSQYGEGGVGEGTSRQLQNLVKHAIKFYGVTLTDIDNDLPRDGTLVYRGHKDPNPFSKGEDAKADGNKLYYSNTPSYAIRTYSLNLNPDSSQIGQAGGHTFQYAIQGPNMKVGRGGFKYGFFSVMKPKNPDDIQWYKNFGYEDLQNRPQDSDFKKLAREQIANVNDAECVEPKESFKNFKTYLVFEYGGGSTSLVNFKSIQKEIPELYSWFTGGSVLRHNDSTRVY